MQVTTMAFESSVIIKDLSSNVPGEEMRFTDSFTIGRSKECDITISNNAVSRKHTRIEFDGGRWLVMDLDSGNGTFVDGERVEEAILPEIALIELGKGGPQLSLRVTAPEKPQVNDEPVLETVQLHAEQSKRADFATETQVIKHYLSDSEDAGEQTMMIRRAFNRAHKTRSKKYKYLIGLAVLLLFVACGIIIYQKNKLDKMRTTAQNIFYLMKEQDVQIAKLEDVVLLNANPAQIAELQAKRNKSEGMEKEYDKFVKELGVYTKLSEEDRIILKIARVFGECELAMPKDFVNEVKRYISIWKSTDRLQTSLRRAEEKGYTTLITQMLKENNLPYQYLFLAMQESNFDERAVGPPTRFGHAKGMWQFISLTANDYGLRIGPKFDKPEYDRLDERFDYLKATRAAVRYLKDLNSTDAQASGLMAMASYNWGDGNVRKMIGRMPENPRDRNFWKLLAQKNIPQETYDYVFLIFSAAVICENPQLFGFNLAGVSLPLTSALPAQLRSLPMGQSS